MLFLCLNFSLIYFSPVYWPFHSGIDITGSTVGFAFVGTMCSETTSVGLTQDGGRSLSTTASIAAHELGHIFNMNHDGTQLSVSVYVIHLWLNFNHFS